MTLQIEEVVGRVKAHVDEVNKANLTKAEADERIGRIEKELRKQIDEIGTTRVKKVEDELKTVTEALAKERASGRVISDGSYQTDAAKWLAANGFNTVKSPADPTNNTAAKSVTGVTIFDVNPFGQTVGSLVVPDSVRSVLAVADQVHIVDAMMRVTKSKRAEWAALKAEKGEHGAFAAKFPALAAQHDGFVKAFKSLTTSGANTGADWIPNAFATSVLDQIRLQMPLVNLIPHVNQPANPWTYPVRTGVGKAYRKPELANATQSDLGTDDKTWTAHAHSVYQAYSDEISEDSIVAIASEVRAAIVRAMGEGVEEAIVNGDPDAAAHFDFDYRAASAPYYTYQGGIPGLRHYALDNGAGAASVHDAGGGALTFSDISAALPKMLKFGAGRLASGDVAFLLNVKTYLDLLTEASSPLITPDKYGAQATLLTGELGRIYGVPVFISHGIEQRRAKCHTNGKNTTGQANNLSTSLLVNRTNFRIGDRRDFRLETDRDIIAGRNDLVATMRMSMNSIEGNQTAAGWDPSSTPAVVAIINHT